MAATADVVTTVGIDNRQALAALDQIGDRYEEQLKRAQGTADSIRRALIALAHEGKETTDQYQDLVGQLAAAELEIEGLGAAARKVNSLKLDAFERMQQDAADAADNVASVEKRIRAAAAEGKKGTAEFAAMQKELAAAKADAAGLAKNVADAEGAAKATGSSFADMKSKLSEGVKGGDPLGGISSALGAMPPQAQAAVAGITAVAAVTAKAVSAAREYAQAEREVAISTGLSGEALGQLSDAAKNAYVRGVGESASEALKIVGQLRQTLGDSVPLDSLDDVAAKSAQVAKSLGVETPELVAKLSPIIKQYGLDFDSALNLVASGAQQGVSDIGGYLDALQEFTPNSKEAGASVETFTGRLAIASQNGVKDVAKVGDAYLELNNKIKSGDLSTAVSAIGGAVGQQLQEIARLAQDGKLTADEAAQQMVTKLDEAAKQGVITANTQRQALVGIFGSKAEDLGNEITTKVFGGKIDEAAIKANAAKAGEAIQSGLGAQDPFEKLSKSVDLFLQGAGKPVMDALNEIGDLLGQIFGDVNEAGGGIEQFGEVVGEVVAFSTVQIRALLKVVAEVTDGIRSVVDFVDTALGGDNAKKRAEGAAKAQTDALKKQKAAAEDLTKEAASLARQNKLNTDTVKQLADKYGVSVQEAQKLVGSSKEVGAAAKAAVTDINNLAASFQNAQAAANQAVALYTSGIAQLELDITKAEKEGNKERVAQLRAELAEKKKAQEENQKQARALEVAASNADLVGNVDRQRALRQIRQSALQQEAKDAAVRTANLIANARERERKLLEIEQSFAVEALKLQIDTAARSTREEIDQRTALQKQLEDLIKNNDAAKTALENRFAQEDIQLALDREKAKTDAVIAGEQERLAAIQRTIARRGTATAEMAREEADTQIKLARLTADQQARAYIEGLESFQKKRGEIAARAGVGEITREQAIAEIQDLYTSTAQRLTDDALTGGDEFARNYVAIFQSLNNSIEDINRDSARRIARIGIEADTDLFRRAARLTLDDAQEAYRERLRMANGNISLERQAWREFAGERRDIERQFLRDTSELYNASAVFRTEVERAFTQRFTDELEQQTSAAREQYAKQLDELESAVARGEVTWSQYRERAGQIADETATEQISVARRIADGFIDAINTTLAAALQRRSDLLQKELEDDFNLFEQNNDKIESLERERADAAIASGKARAEGNFAAADEQLQRYNDLTAEQVALQQDQGDLLVSTFEKTGTSALLAFGQMALSGKNVWKSMAKAALDGLQSLVPILIAQIFGVQVASTNPVNGLTFGAAGLASAAALTLGFQGLVAIAKSALRLNKGDVDIALGRNPRGVDTIPAWLDEGESVITRKATRARRPGAGPNAELLRWLNSTGRHWTEAIADLLPRNIIGELILKSNGIVFDDLVERGYQAAMSIHRSTVINNNTTVTMNTERLERKIETLTETVSQLRHRVLQDVDIDINLKPDTQRLFKAVEAEQASRNHHIG